jgi:hypothetical protein
MSNDRIDVLIAFFEIVAEDPRMTPVHISLYLALLSEHPAFKPNESIPVRRAQLMAKARLGARSTYDKAMHDLHAFRYLLYYPSRQKGMSRVLLRKLE